MIIFRAKFLEQGVEVYHHLVEAEGTKIKYRETFIFFLSISFSVSKLFVPLHAGISYNLFQNSDVMNKTTLEFVTFCIGKLAQVLHLSQNEVYKRLKRSGILYDYIVPSYDVLHTFSSRYLVEDLIEYMREKGELAS